MRRRDFIAVAGGAAAWPLTARTQTPALPRVGVLVLGHAASASFASLFKEAMERHGYVEDRTVEFHIRSARGVDAALPSLASELVQLKCDVIVAQQSQAVFAARQATATIPIVMAGVGDPVGTGLVASLARPGGNITGASAATGQVMGKNVELLREALPAARSFVVLASSSPFGAILLAEIEAAAAKLDLGVHVRMTDPTEPLEPVFEEIGRLGVDAVLLQGNLLRKEAIDLAIRHRLPPFAPTRPGPAAGGLMAYNAHWREQFDQPAEYVDRILKGAKPADLPVAQPTRFELVINLRTAKAVGLTIPQMLLMRADEVIE